MWTKRLVSGGAMTAALAAVTVGLGSCAHSSFGTPEAFHVQRGFSLSEDMQLGPHDREMYEAERHNDVFPEHNVTNGIPPWYTPGSDKKHIWHYGQDLEAGH